MRTAGERLHYAINHITAPKLGWRDVAGVAADLGLRGLELRTDLGRPLFDGDAPSEVRDTLEEMGLTLLALAEVSAFNDGSDRVLSETAELARLAAESGARSVIFIPRVGGAPVDYDPLCRSLEAIKPILMAAGVRGLIEPIGFETSTLRDFAKARCAIDTVDGGETFGVVHDTFHHHLSGGGTPSARYVELIHVSGVCSGISARDMRDDDRGFVDADDVLGNASQLAILRAEGCTAPASMEAFSPSVHAISDPREALRGSFDRLEIALSGAMTPRGLSSETAPSGVPV